jgi:chorismate mutase
MNREIINEVTDTIVDKIYQETEYYMYEVGKYKESNDKFVEDMEKYVVEVIKELNYRIKEVK